MAGYLWGNPTPGGPTAAQLQSTQQVNPINMSGVVTAILEHQRMQQQQQQQYQAQLAQGVQALSQQYQQGEQDDLANRAIYSAQHPNDPYSGQSGYDDRVPDYGGTNALHMQQIEAQLGNQGLNTQLLQAKVNAEQALGYNRYTHPPNSGSDDDTASVARALKEQRIAAQAELDAAKRSYSSASGTPLRDLSKVDDALNQYTSGSSEFPALGTHKAIKDDSEGSYKDTILSARTQYQNALNKLQGLNSTPQPSAQAGSNSQSGPPAGTQGIVNGMRAQWDGHGWVAIP